MSDNGSRKREPIWSDTEDMILGDIILKHISTGSTQLKGFTEASDRLVSRTSGACSFRWNSFLRKKLKNEIIEARKKKNSSKSRGHKIGNPQFYTASGIQNTSELSTVYHLEQVLSPEKVKTVIDYVQDLSSIHSLFRDLHASLEEKDLEISCLKEENQELLLRNKILEEDWQEFSTLAERFKQRGNGQFTSSTKNAIM
ncbi:hypothetical protein IAQ67_15135 [Paenibacillus peoriae]|uniref:RsfA family transcriptional regulator n=1 Tax=Paenibacillus peoriae TaxID=59893 RepID=A0A7H0Y2D9_9BACL|nr:hypothetical protein [Paenibacillus peoriae]QNR65247.1 hypothetical protein IAQ67_15135 [Paenibacillus peoriae]